MKPVRIGCVKYLNARLLIHGWSGGAVDFDHPAALCRKLDRGDLDTVQVDSAHDGRLERVHRHITQ